MKNCNVVPLDKSVIKPWGMENPGLGEKWVESAKKFFDAYPRTAQLTSSELTEAINDLFPDWSVERDLTVAETVRRINLGGGNKNFGEPRLQVFFHHQSKSWLVIGAMELIDQINIAEKMAKTGQRVKNQLDYVLQIATNQLKLELSAEQQQEVLNAYEAETQGVELATKWADRQTRTLKEAVHAVLGNGDGANGEPATQIVTRSKK